ncbi:MAG TPA: replicative DNA helicase [Thermoanaerobaculia bacterium]|jgi:replicative DNA helicase|nr:replicative DNA helicase [Thermoanaerobaculia bacterium]
MIDTLPQQKALPHSEESERAVLGGVLLDPTILPTISGRLRAEDFYGERHQVLYQAMLDLQEDQVEIDLRTLQAKLEQRGQIEMVGGLAYLTGLDLDLPDIGRIDAYVEIVKERSVRRRLIQTGGEIIRNCLDGGLQAAEALGRAEQAILSLGEEAIQRGFAQLSHVLHTTLEELEERPGTMLTGVPSGFMDFDRISQGLNRGNLIIIAGRPGMGKTSFALNVAQHVAIRERKGVGVFSLEMSQQELALRILCSEADISFSRLRSNRVSQKEWTRIIQTVRAIGDAPLFIDDSPNPTLLEVASKSRRLKAERGLSLVILDYLQLMQAGGRYENRNLEIAAISRGLKQLAKELEVPVIALSQLSRQPERRGSDHRPQLADLRESGCLAGGTLVTLADSGTRAPIRDLAGRSDFAVWALHPESLKMEKAQVSRAFSTGTKPVFQLTTQLGRNIRATANHKFLTIDGWKRLDELSAGLHIALPREVPSGVEQTMSDAEVALLGHLIGDGCTLPRHAIQYTTREEDLAQTVVALAIQAFGDEVRPRINPERSWFQVYLTSTRHHTHGRRSAVAEWLDGLGVWGLRSYEKRLPAKLFEQPEAAIGRFLRHLWSTDGCIRVPRKGRGYPAIYYATSSPELARDVQALLARVGLRGRLEVHPQPGKGRDQYHVKLSGRSQILRFADAVGAVGAYKTACLAEALANVTARPENTNRDIIPREVWDLHVRPAMKESGVTHRRLHTEIGTAYAGLTIFKQNLSRERAMRVAVATQAEALRILAESDIYWDQVASIQEDGVEEVFDLSVPGPHNFVAGDLYVHNSIEQDADMVAFIYRDEVYTPTDENKGLAELIIAKHRNGETGTVELVFLGETTSFRNLDRHGMEPSGAPF